MVGEAEGAGVGEAEGAMEGEVLGAAVGAPAHSDARQVPLAQSSATKQPAPTSHATHSPPQSTSVSWPFFLPSAQCDSVGLAEGLDVGGGVGLRLGAPVLKVGAGVGLGLGAPVGLADGASVGDRVGLRLGASVGLDVLVSSHSKYWLPVRSASCAAYRLFGNTCKPELS